MDNQSGEIFIANLQSIYKSKKYPSVKAMSESLLIPTGTLKCWMTGNRTPKLTNLDNLANILGCYSFNLIMPQGNFSDIGIHNNDIHRTFTRQLQILFLKHQAGSYLNKLFLLNNIISYDTLVSYFRQDNYRLPTLFTLDKIANQFNVYSYELIREDAQNVKKD